MERRRKEGVRKREIPEKTRRPTASSCTIATCQNPATRRGTRRGTRLYFNFVCAYLRVSFGYWPRVCARRHTLLGCANQNSVIPTLDVSNGLADTMNHYGAQLFTVHGNFKAKLHGFRLVQSPLYDACGVDDTMEHVIANCLKTIEIREWLKMVAERKGLYMILEMQEFATRNAKRLEEYKGDTRGLSHRARAVCYLAIRGPGAVGGNPPGPCPPSRQTRSPARRLGELLATDLAGVTAPPPPCRRSQRLERGSKNLLVISVLGGTRHLENTLGQSRRHYKYLPQPEPTVFVGAIWLKCGDRVNSGTARDISKEDGRQRRLQRVSRSVDKRPDEMTSCTKQCMVHVRFRLTRQMTAEPTSKLPTEAFDNQIMHQFSDLFAAKPGACIEQRRNAGAGQTGEPRENPSTSDIIRHDSHTRKSWVRPVRKSNPDRLDWRRASATALLVAEALAFQVRAMGRSCSLVVKVISPWLEQPFRVRYMQDASQIISNHHSACYSLSSSDQLWNRLPVTTNTCINQPTTAWTPGCIDESLKIPDCFATHYNFDYGGCPHRPLGLNTQVPLNVPTNKSLVDLKQGSSGAGVGLPIIAEMAFHSNMIQPAGHTLGAGMQEREKREHPEKTRRQAVSSSTIPTCENPRVNPPGILPGSPWWETSALTAAPRCP
ncbi:hypothetical protein PR048_019024 [Dryococelus australis]|uniref:Uncharacterized protein n=1 Tax=Dryococelus australis TaxID=614101 RepID=A0ABQ9H2B3_9NEOP|nr:hypothetical protein PR048_019024 [Dryococelus australis]